VADLASHMASKQVAKFKYPEAVLLVDEMPMTASGKIRKEALRPLVLKACAPA
jgi:acyl-coenzyme A synthetase/AMP-(fatty) acid ligase